MEYKLFIGYTKTGLRNNFIWFPIVNTLFAWRENYRKRENVHVKKKHHSKLQQFWRKNRTYNVRYDHLGSLYVLTFPIFSFLLLWCFFDRFRIFFRISTFPDVFGQNFTALRGSKNRSAEGMSRGLLQIGPLLSRGWSYGLSPIGWLVGYLHRWKL